MQKNKIDGDHGRGRQRRKGRQGGKKHPGGRVKKKLIYATGLYVSPGFIDIHTHVFGRKQATNLCGCFSSLSPDDLPSGRL